MINARVWYHTDRGELVRVALDTPPHHPGETWLRVAVVGGYSTTRYRWVYLGDDGAHRARRAFVAVLDRGIVHAAMADPMTIGDEADSGGLVVGQAASRG